MTAVSERPTSSDPSASSLRPDSIGTIGVMATVISAAAPLTVMAGVAPIALAIGGVGVPGAYLLAGVVLAIFAIGFTAMAATIRRTGGFFVYIGHAFGGTAGFAAAVLAIVSYNLLQIGVYGLFGIQTRAALDDLFGVTASVVGDLRDRGRHRVRPRRPRDRRRSQGARRTDHSRVRDPGDHGHLDHRPRWCARARVRLVQPPQRLPARRDGGPGDLLRRVHGLRVDGVVPRRGA